MPANPLENPESLSSAEAADLRHENARLKEQVKDLMAAENRLYVLQDHLNAQQRVYVRLAELGRTLNATFDVSKLIEMVVRFVVYGFNYERCVAFLGDEQGILRMAAHEGYYDEAQRTALSQATLTGQEPGLAGIDGEPGFVCQSAAEQSPETRALSKVFLLDEYFVFALPSKRGGLRGLLVGGNTREQARFQTGVESDGEMLVAFSNLAGQTAAVINNVDSFHALERERQLLDGMVANRTQELSEALDAAHEAVRLKSQFLANISHELRTPLNSIVNVPQALLRDFSPTQMFECSACESQFEADDEVGVDPLCPDCGRSLSGYRAVTYVGDPEEHRRFLQLLTQQGDHLLQLVEDVLDFSQAESGNVDLNVTVVNTSELIAEVKDTFDSAANAQQCTVKYPTLLEPLYFVADRLRVKQVLLNLISNALKFTPSSGEVRLSVQELAEPPGTIEFSVADDGIGIPADQLEAIFESFRQVDGSHTRNHSGVGLGLAICRQLVELHGGEISVSSKLGEGSDFRVRLPRNDDVARSLRPVDEPPSSELDAPERAERQGHGHVLIVDDEPAQLSTARRILEREGYEVTLARSAKAALAVIEAGHPRFVLTDVMMPEFSGLWLLAQIRTNPKTRALPVIVSSGYLYNQKKAELGGGFWLPKPWNLQKLSAAHIETVLDTGLDRNGPVVKRREGVRLSDLVSRILYVEDEDANWEVTQLSLRGKYELSRARSSQQAFSMIASQAFDLILMDIQLKGSELNGIEACEILTGKRTESVPLYAQGVHFDGPIVIVTAYAALHDKAELRLSGAKELISKPVDFTHLLMVLSRIMVQGAVSKIHAAE